MDFESLKKNASSSLAKLKRFLRLWCAMMTQLRLRDRLVKIIQYGCQMILGYWSPRIREYENTRRQMQRIEQQLMCGSGAVGGLVSIAANPNPNTVTAAVATTAAAAATATADAASSSLLTSLALLRRTASTSRKAFWLLKFMNNLMEVNNSLEIYFDKERSLTTVQAVDTIEHVFLSMYYYYESLIFFARCKMFGLEESKLDFMCNFSWFAGDMTFMVSSTMRLVESLRRYLDSNPNSNPSPDPNPNSNPNPDLDGLNAQADADADADADGNRIRLKTRGTLTDSSSSSSSSSSSGGGGGGGGGGGADVALLRRNLADVALLRRNLFDSCLSVAIASLELGVSLHYMDVYTAILGSHINDGHVGLMGVCSSVLILFEGYLRQDRTM